MGSNTRFGLVLVAACALVYGWGLWSGSGHTGWLIAAAILAAITLTVPRVLEPMKNLWLKFGGLLHVVVSPVLLALFYYTAVTRSACACSCLGWTRSASSAIRRRIGSSASRRGPS